MQNKQKNTLLSFFRSPIKMFLFLAILAGAFLLLAFLLSKGKLIEHYFAWDPLDTGMDYFNSIAYTVGGVPYSQFGTLYPPLANLFFFSLLHLVPQQISSTWSTSYESLITMRLQPNDLRLQQSTMLFFLIFLVIVCSLFCFLVERILEEKKHTESYAVSLACLLSFGFTWAIERGNIIILSLALSLFYLAFYKNSRAVMRECAYIALALAAGLKLYPAFLGILLLHDMRWKAALRTVLYGAAAFILPCLILKDGFKSITLFFDILFKYGNQINNLNVMGCSIKNMIYSLISFASYTSGVDVTAFYPWLGIGQMIAYLLCLALLVAGLFVKTSNWKRLLLISLAMICIQAAPYYMLIYMLIPFIFFLKEEGKLNRHNVVYFVLMAALIIQLPFFDNSKQLKMKALQVQICTLGLLILVIRDIVFSRMRLTKYAEDLPIKG
jgi:hypothetical protein